MSTVFGKGPWNEKRNISAVVDLIVWTFVLWLTWQGTMELAYSRFGRPVHSGRDPRDEITVLSFGFAALCANLYFAISNGAGASLGKAVTGLRLVAFAGPYPATPGFARGFVRSALQALPCMGIAMAVTGLHDTFAGTAVVEAPKWDAPYPHPPRPARIALWKIAAAVVLHLFSAMFYALVSAI